MPIHYRCRCGQEVVLRPREGVYVVVGLLVGLTLLNTALLIFLFGRVDELAAPSPSPAAPPAVSAGETEEPAREVEIPPGEVVPAALPTHAAFDGDPAADAEGAANAGSPPGPPAAIGAPPAPAPAAVAEIALPPPEGLDPALLPVLLADAEPGSLDRTLVLLAACRWGGELAPRAADLLRAEAPLIFEAITPGEAGDPNLLLRRPDRGGARGELAALAQVWPARWRHILERARTDPRSEWGRALAAAGGESPVDLVLLVDLSESMTAEVESARIALRAMLPALLSARPGWRLGWIGYRDEVADRMPLAADAAALVESLGRWRAEGGGDVPEALDEALFEAFRVGGFPWRREARHRFIVLGDAPPPYERIAGMVELARAAHESPERFEVDCLGILREEGSEEVPGFRALAAAAGGTCTFLKEGMDSIPTWWRLLAGADAPPWDEESARRP